MVRKLSKGTDIGDRISDMNREGELCNEKIHKKTPTTLVTV
jgi:hypothetical protein